MAAIAEAASEAAAFDRIAHQELLGAVAVLVIVVDRIVRSAEAIEFAVLAADGYGGVKQLAHSAVAHAVVVEEHFEGVAGAGLLLEVDVVGVDAQQLENDVGGELLVEGGLVEALIQGGAVGGALDLDLAVRRLGGGEIVAVAVAGRADDVVAVFVEDADTNRLHLAGIGGRGHEAEVDLLPRLQIVRAEHGVEAVENGAGQGLV